MDPNLKMSDLNRQHLQQTVVATQQQCNSCNSNNNDNFYENKQQQQRRSMLTDDEVGASPTNQVGQHTNRPHHVGRRRRHLLQSTLSPIRLVKERINFAGGIPTGSTSSAISSSAANQSLRNQTNFEMESRSPVALVGQGLPLVIENGVDATGTKRIVPGTDRPPQPPKQTPPRPPPPQLPQPQTSFGTSASPQHHHHHQQHSHAQCFHPFPPYISSYFSENSLQFMKTGNYYCKSPHSKEFIDVGQMEDTLYRLLADFHMEKLHAFGDGVTFENMIKVREQQENLARLHFELNLQQSNKQSFENDFFNDSLGGSSIMSKLFSKSNMQKLIQNLQNLCKSIEKLQLKNSQESSDQFFN